MSAPTAILLVEDDEAIASGLVRVLDSQGYEVRASRRAGAPRSRGAAEARPGDPRPRAARHRRASTSAGGCARRGPSSAILILTARDQELDVVAGLDAGADDYLDQAVPALRAAGARARAPAPHGQTPSAPSADEPLRAGDDRRSTAARRAWRGGDELALRPKEFDLLALLVAEAGRAVTRERIMHEVWDTDWLGSTKTLDTHILALRSKLGAEAITTLRGVGYRLEVP